MATIRPPVRPAPGTGSPVPDGQADTPQRGASASRTGPSVLHGLKQRIADLRPNRYQAGTATLVASTTTTGSATRPDVRRNPRPDRVVTDAELGPHRRAAIESKVVAGQQSLFKPDVPDHGVPQVPEAQRAMADAGHFRTASARLFGGGEAAESLAQRLLANQPPAAEGPHPHKGPVVLASALHALCGPDPSAAEKLLDALVAGEESAQVFALQRLLASTVNGNEVLTHITGLEQPPEQAAHRRDALRLCSALEAAGFPIGEHTSVNAVVGALAAQADLRMEHDIGTEHDAPLQLLAKAVTHAHGMSEGSAPAGAPHKAAYVAWQKGGFTTSGPGSEFNQTIERLYKFMTYVDRADHGPRTAGNLLREMGDLFPRAIGHRKSPLSNMRHGTMGSDLGTLREEAEKFRQALGDTIDPLRHQFMRDLARPEIQASAPHLNARLACAATLDLMQALGRTHIKVSADDVVARAREIETALGRDPARVDEALIRKTFKTLDKPRVIPNLGSRATLHLRMLEELGQRLIQTHPLPAGKLGDPADLKAECDALKQMPDRTPVQEARLDAMQLQLLHLTHGAVEQARTIKAGGPPRIPLFKMSDLLHMAGSTPREGPTAADAKDVAKRLAQARYESMSTFTHSAAVGVNVPGVMVLKAVKKVGIPVVYPIVRADAGVRASVTVGVSNTGGRLFVGKDFTANSEIGAGAAWVFDVPLTKLSTGLFGQASAGADWSGKAGRLEGGGGACITTRNDVEGSEGKLAEVVDFMFETAKPELAEADAGAARVPDLLDPAALRARERTASRPERPQTPGDFWNRFVDRFGDDPCIGISWDRETSASAAVGAAAGAFARGEDAKDASIGPTASANVRAGKGLFRRGTDALGADVPTQVRSSLVTAGAGLSVAQASPLFSKNDTHDIVGVGVAATPLHGISAQWNLAGGVGVAKLGRTADGLLSAPVCQREYIFRDRNRLIEYANSHRAEWEAAMVDQDPTGKTTPADARERLNDFLVQVKSAPSRSDMLYGNLMTLKPEKAAHINDLESVAKTLIGGADGAGGARPPSEQARIEHNRIQNEISHLLMDDTSWNHAGIYSVELPQHGHNFGVSALLGAGSQEAARGARLTSLLIAGQPGGEAPDAGPRSP
jgi:hypothetical protein